MQRELCAFLSLFAVISLTVHLDSMAYLFGLGALVLLAKCLFSSSTVAPMSRRTQNQR